VFQNKKICTLVRNTEKLFYTENLYQTSSVYYIAIYSGPKFQT